MLRPLPDSLKAFKDSLTMGTRLHLVAAGRYDHEGVRHDDTTHLGLNILREVAVRQTKDIGYKLLEGERAGRISYMPWPKASQLLMLNDHERGFYGFTITDKEAGVQLSYHFA